jgi:opacity protein-like surface antigen
MRKKSLGLFLGSLLCLSGAAFPETVGVKRFFAQIDAYEKEDAYEATEKDWKDALQGAGGIVSLDSEIRGALGGRLGMFFPIEESRFELGGSVGYIVGPWGKFTIDETVFSQRVTSKDEYRTDFPRALLETQFRIPLSDRAEFRLRGGAGVTRGRLTRDYSLGIAGFFSGSTIQNESETWTGFTWEAGPSFAYVGESVVVDLGVMYAEFPKMKANQDKNLSEFKWNPIGVRLSIEF